MLRAAGIDWSGMSIAEEVEMETIARRRIQAESALASLVSGSRR